MILTPRLQLIYDIIPKCNAVADIGTDHGYIPISAVCGKKCNSALAMDVNKGPLDAAKLNIAKYGVADSVATRLSNGLENLNKGEADVIVIAGMGGPLIGEIIKKGIDAITDDTILILQPMIAQKELREFLCGNGFKITDEYVCREENKFYNILKVKKGTYNPTLKELYIGKNVKQNSPKVYCEYIEHKLKVAQKILLGLKKSSDDKSTQINLVQKEIDIYREEQI